MQLEGNVRRELDRRGARVVHFMRGPARAVPGRQLGHVVADQLARVVVVAGEPGFFVDPSVGEFGVAFRFRHVGAAHLVALGRVRGRELGFGVALFDALRFFVRGGGGFGGLARVLLFAFAEKEPSEDGGEDERDDNADDDAGDFAGGGGMSGFGGCDGEGVVDGVDGDKVLGDAFFEEALGDGEVRPFPVHG